MKLFAIPLMLVTLALAGCVTDKSVFEGGTSLTASVNNPIGRRELATFESAYGLALTAAVAYRRLGICKARQVESFAHPCARRSVLLQMQQANHKVRLALIPARRFVRDNPTISAFSALAAARAALADLNAVQTTNGVR